MFSDFLSSWNLCLISHLKQFLMTDLVTLYPRRLFTCVITFLVKRSINKVNSVIFGIKTDAGYSRHHNCHTKGNRSKKHDDMVGLRNFKNRKFIIIKTLIETFFWVKQSFLPHIWDQALPLQVVLLQMEADVFGFQVWKINKNQYGKEKQFRISHEINCKIISLKKF